ncbi:FtsK/SpoIIIE domain-containing protein [Inediibacterium massiliense]|uniref:FtsK/SpoIIIE domain-containing protein n=1 Tax=Inediibacterium massiliense TaxID=1658111 RepID=UPI0006B4472D|nr:FtsK/SpoIIIE domain-containing protein [Inediibacterium massiliense]
MNKEMNPENSLLVAGTGSIIVGAMCSAFVANPLYADALYSAGIGSIVCNFISNRKSEYTNLFENLGLCNKDGSYPIKLSKKDTSYGHELRFSIPIGLSLDDFEKHQKAIESFLKHRVKIGYDNGKNAVIKVFENELKKMYPYENIETKPYIVPLGYGFGEKLITLDLRKAIHILIASETGGGKSSVLRLLLTYLVKKTNAKVHLIDLKGGVEGRLFQQYVKTFVKDIENAEMLIYKIKEEVERRYDLLFKSNCVDIDEYNRKHKENQLSREFLIIDEFSVLGNDKDTKDLIKVIEDLGALARASGIHLILCTQRPDAKILSPRIKANCPTVIGLKTRDNVNSRIIGIEGLEKLRGNGHSILQFEGKDTELQFMFLDADQARNILKDKFKKSKDKKAVFIPKQNVKVEEDDLNLEIFKDDLLC